MSSHTAFQSPRALARLNIAAVGLSLAAATGTVFSGVFQNAPVVPFATALPTLALGILWARMLRSPRTVGNTKLRVGWLASVPLAALNAAIACGLLFASNPTEGDRLQAFLVGGFAGALIGALFWVPALIATLVCFGLPIASAQRLAKLGLAGEERGEVQVGVASAVVGTGALSIETALYAATHTSPGAFGPLGVGLLYALAVLGIGAGATAALLANARAKRRRAFVAQAEAGKVQGYRVDTTSEGKVLVRVVAQGGEGYRVADFEEAVSAVDAQGNVTDVDRAARVVGGR